MGNVASIADHTNSEVLFDKLKEKKDDKYVNKQKFIEFTNTTTDLYICNRTNKDNSKKNDQIKSIIESLHAKGIKITSESVNIEGNLNVLQSIIKDNIDQTGCFIFILTKEYFNNISNPTTYKSNEFNCNLFEYNYIIQTRGTNRIIPVVLEEDEDNIESNLIPSNLKNIPCIDYTKGDQNEDDRIGLDLYNRIINIIRTPVLIKMKHFLVTSSFNNIENANQVTINNKTNIITDVNQLPDTVLISATNTSTTKIIDDQKNHVMKTNTNSISNVNNISDTNLNQINETKLSYQRKTQNELIDNNTNSKEQKIKNCLKLIRNADEVIKKRALETLQNQSYEDTNKIIIAREGGISICIALLKFGDVYEKHQAIKILNNLASNQSNRIAITKAGGIPYLMAILRDDGDRNDDKMIAINVLSKLAIDGTNNILVSIEGIPLLITLLKKSNTSFREKKQIMKALMDLLVHNHNNALIIEQCGGISLVLSIFKNESSDYSLKTAAALLLSSLIMSDETLNNDIVAFICSSGCMSILIAMLQIDGIESHKIKDVIITIGILCIASELNKNICADEGGVSILVDLLKHCKHKDEINTIAEALCCIATSSLKNQQLIRKEGGIPLLVKLLGITLSSSDGNNSNNTNVDIYHNQLIKEKMQLVKLIKILITNNDDNRELFIQSGCVLMLKSLIVSNENHKDNENIIIIEDTLNTLIGSQGYLFIGNSNINNKKMNKKQTISYKEENIDILQDMSYANIIISKRKSGYTSNN